jgi:uncharacterized repeat protein (TIGR03803 family)
MRRQSTGRRSRWITRNFTVLHTFTAQGPDGQSPWTGLVEDRVANLYGATDTRCGGQPLWHGMRAVSRAGDLCFGWTPQASTRCNLYGTTLNGGTTGCGGPDCGTIFKLDLKGKKTILHKFTSGTDGANPQQGLISDSAGVLYGTTRWGGDPQVTCGNTTTGCGAVFKIAP